MAESIGEIRVDDENFEVTSENVSLYRHLGAHAVYDHLFVVIGENGGAYIWSHHSQFKKLAKLAARAQATMHFNIREPSPTDVKNYIRHATSDLSDTFPEEWLEEGSES